MASTSFAARRSPRFALLIAIALVPAAVAAAGGGGAAGEPARAADSGASLEARGLTLGASVSRVYRSQGADGRVVFSDRPEPGARSVEVRSFASSSDAQARATARREQEYWRAQAAAMAERRKEREEAERARLEAEREADSRGFLLIVPQHLRAPWAAAPSMPVPPQGFAQVYPSSPGAAAGAPAAFIGSGFSTAR